MWPSYGYNGWLSVRSYAALDRGDATARAAFVDANATKIGKPEHMQISDDKGTPPGRIVPRHIDGANLAFTDGHVKWLRPEAILPSMFNPDWEP
jgi:prepilin-type processing-associated H-X9-DG protein